MAGALFAGPGRALRRFAAFSIGLIPPLAVIVCFKLAVAPPNDLIANQSYHETIQKIFDVSRHAAILEYLGLTLWSFGAWKLQPMIPVFAFLL